MKKVLILRELQPLKNAVRTNRVLRQALLCVIMLTSAAAFAETLDLEQARVLALANSRSLMRYEMAIRSSVLDEKNQLYSMLPSVSAGYSASMDYLRNWEFLNPIDTFNAGVTLSVTQII